MTDDFQSDIIEIDQQALKKALLAFHRDYAKPTSNVLRMAIAIAAYLKASTHLKGFSDFDEMPVAEKYSNPEDLYIAKAERERANSIISGAFARVEWSDNLDKTEFSFFLAVLQREIEGN